jgi:hypothetical protein
VSAWTRGQWALRCVIVAGVLLGLGSTLLAGASPSAFLVVVVIGLSLGYARLPESAVGSVTLAVVAGWWAVGVPGLHPAVLLGAAGLLAAHVAGLVAAYGPDELAPDPGVLRRWLLRGLAVLLVAPALYGAALVLRGRSETPGAWLVGLAVAVVATLLATWAVVEPEEEP